MQKVPPKPQQISAPGSSVRREALDARAAAGAAAAFMPSSRRPEQAS